MSRPYDMSIHTNPDAQAWAKFFMKCKAEYGWEVDEETMRGWFANAMMAMHDFMEIQRRKTLPVEVAESLPLTGGEFERAEQFKSQLEKRTTTDGQPPDPGYEAASAPGPINPETGQHRAYWVLSEEERKKGWVRPLRRKYVHVGLKPKYPLRDLTQDELETYGLDFDKYEEYPEESERPATGRFWTKKELAGGCGVVTSMGLALCETYSANPKYYSSTFCAGCRTHLPVEEFVWDEDGQEVGA
jgi:hypothetical protein